MLKSNMGCVKRLLSYPNVDVNCKDDQGKTLVCLSVCAGMNWDSYEQIRYLLEEKVCQYSFFRGLMRVLQKADPNITDLGGNNALHYVCQLRKESTFGVQNVQAEEKGKYLV